MSRPHGGDLPRAQQGRYLALRRPVARALAMISASEHRPETIAA
jgi:hypothetical protein